MTATETGFKVGLVLGVAAAHQMIGRIETTFNSAETYCPWNWSCHHLSKDLPEPKITQIIKIEPTTTAARRSGPAEIENAYLARFLQPASRVGELLKIDDQLAGSMWAACVAVNSALTPREFVSIANAKLASWGRIDDKRPGLTIKSSLTGLLKASMPNAVCGAWYMAAHEAAPAELESDCYKARHILASDGEYSPWWRAWARAVLIEAGESET